MSSIPQEDVLVVPRSLLEQAGMFQGFCGEVDRYLPTLLDPQQTLWMPRAAAAEVRLGTLMENRAIMTRRGLPGRSYWHVWETSFRWRVPGAAAISG